MRQGSILYQFFCFLGLTFLTAWPEITVAHDSTRVSVGAYYSTGTYGTSVTTEIEAISFGVRYRYGSWVIGASVPWLRIRGGGILPDGTLSIASGGTREGIGDLVASLERRLFYWRHLGLSLRGKVKFPTASRKKGLGTGERDYILELRGFGRLGRSTLFGALGYKKYGDTATVNYHDVWQAHAGISFPLARDQKLGLSAGYRQNTRSGRDARRTLMLFHSIKWDADWKLQSYLVKGFGDAAADLAGGLALKRRY